MSDLKLLSSTKGLIELPVKQLAKPPQEAHLLREADPTFVLNVKKKMIQDPSAPGATPMALLCKDCGDVNKFNMKYKNVCKYEVLGGLHTLMAMVQLAKEYPDNPFFKTVLAEVYNVCCANLCRRVRAVWSTYCLPQIVHVSAYMYITSVDWQLRPKGIGKVEPLW